MKQLAGYKGSFAKGLLESIALGRAKVIDPGTQDQAIAELASRRNPADLVAIANLLQPSEGIDLRQEIAKSLLVDGCPLDCVRAVAHYLERVNAGEPNVEDTAQRSYNLEGELKAFVHTDIQKHQAQLYANLRRILADQQPSTVAVLRDVYGLGTESPSTFAFKLISTIKLPAACGDLLRSQQLANIAPIHPLEEQLREAIEFQGCRH